MATYIVGFQNLAFHISHVTYVVKGEWYGQAWMGRLKGIYVKCHYPE
jgi:hypothetical protein